MASAKGVIGSRPGTHRVRAHTKRTRAGFISVREHTAVNALQTRTTSVRSPGLKRYMAQKASNRSKMIRDARDRALSGRY